MVVGGWVSMFLRGWNWKISSELGGVVSGELVPHSALAGARAFNLPCIIGKLHVTSEPEKLREALN